MNGLFLAATRSSDSLAALTFFDIAVIVVLARLAGNAMRWIRQPAVIGEIIVGILLGPTLLGAFPGHLTNHVFPLDVRPYLSDIAQIGLACVLGYADFRFADCGWRKAYPKLDAFHHRMLERPSVKISAPPPA